MPSNLIVILGDQLSHSVSSLHSADPSRDHVMMAEVADEAGYVPHHKKKIAFVFSAMRHFAEELKEKGFKVRYSKLDDNNNTGSLTSEVVRAAKDIMPDQILITEPGEWRVAEMLKNWSCQTDTKVTILTDNRFVATSDEFKDWASGRKSLRMEYFYRDMRRKTGLLMTNEQPVGDKWNFDSENRKPARNNLFMPQPAHFTPDGITKEVLALVGHSFSENFGDLEPFWFAVTAKQAEGALDHFIKTALPDFGTYQDAMLEGERFLYHAVIALYLNIGLLEPLAVCEKAEAAYHSGAAPLNSVEGFIRQIIGWREYIRGIYWLKMPEYVEQNFFGSTRPLPAFYWTAETDLACIRDVVTQTKEEAYAHHIQRLMITGNYALLIGADPKAVHEWYLSVYADAFEWVELPNTLGMSQFADGGLLGSKPYVSSGNYISKMSNYCENCHFDVKKKTGEGACPFNSLYWQFLIRNREKLGDNPRLGNVYRTWDRMAQDKQKEYIESAERYLETLD